ncbi:MAG: phosphotransferase [Gammaproteobacteria bacterium]|nr:phosphotransferase [Gammaproteobacteria bacterium]
MTSKITKRYALVIEDLGHLRPGDQVAGCSPQDAKIALSTMACMHATFLDNKLLTETPWIIPMELTIKLIQQVFRKALPKYLQQYGHTVSNSAQQTLQWMDRNGIELMTLLAEQPSTLNHGDFRLDNLFFDDANNEIILCDWQTLMSGPPGIDLAYFLSASITSEHENEIVELLDFYAQQLKSQGVEIDENALAWQYQAGMLLILLRVIPSEFQDLLILGTNRGHDLAITWLNRIFTRVEHFQLDRILAGPPKTK